MESPIEYPAALFVQNSASDLYFEGNTHQSLQNIPDNQLVQPPVLQQKGGKGRWIHHSFCR